MATSKSHRVPRIPGAGLDLQLVAWAEHGNLVGEVAPERQRNGGGFACWASSVSSRSRVRVESSFN